MASYHVICSNGIEMAYRVWGSRAAPPVVLLPRPARRKATGTGVASLRGS